MKPLFLTSILFILFCLTTNIQAQTISVSGSQSPNATWSADTVKITGDVIIEKGRILKVKPGTYIQSQGYFKIIIHGSIQALGTAEAPIVFTARDTTNFWKDSLSVAGAWGGIHITNSYASADTSIFGYCNLQYGKKYDTLGGDIKGGAIYASEYGALIVRHCEFKSNVVICSAYSDFGTAGGAVYCNNVNQVQIENNWFERNRSFGGGGAICIGTNCHTYIQNNTFKLNSATYWHYNHSWSRGGQGAVVYSSDDKGFSPIISNNYCFNNQSFGGIIYTSNRNGRIFNNVICNNYGSGIVDGHQLSRTKIYNNTIVNNLGYKPGICIYSSAVVYNNICWGNKYQLVYIDSIIPFEQISLSKMAAGYKLFNNCVQVGKGGTNAIYSDPEFVNPTAGAGLGYDGSKADWSLKNWSTCINQGTLDTIGLLLPNTDILGNTRISGNRIEIGAIENHLMMVDIKDIEPSMDKMSISPNPGDNHILIKVIQPANAKFVMYNLFGKPVINQPLTGTILRVSTQSLSSGMYSWQIISNGKEIEMGKWIKVQE